MTDAIESQQKDRAMVGSPAKRTITGQHAREPSDGRECSEAVWSQGRSCKRCGAKCYRQGWDKVDVGADNQKRVGHRKCKRKHRRDGRVHPCCIGGAASYTAEKGWTDENPCSQKLVRVLQAFADGKLHAPTPLQKGHSQ